MHAIIRMSHNVTILYRYISLFLKSSILDIIIMPRGWFPVTGGPPCSSSARQENTQYCNIVAMLTLFWRKI